MADMFHNAEPKSKNTTHDTYHFVSTLGEGVAETGLIPAGAENWAYSMAFEAVDTGKKGHKDEITATNWKCTLNTPRGLYYGNGLTKSAALKATVSQASDVYWPGHTEKWQ